MNLFKMQLRNNIIFIIEIYMFFISSCLGNEIRFSNNSLAAIFLNEKELMSGNSWKSKPLTASKAAENLLEYNAIWCAQVIEKYNPDSWDFIREKKPNIILLYYIGGNNVQNDKHDFTSFDYQYINKYHPEWFLLADAKNFKNRDYSDPNKRMRWNLDPKSYYYNRFFVDVGNHEFQTWCAKYLLNKMNFKNNDKIQRYDGVGIDNVLLTVWHKYITERYPNWKYASTPQKWNQAYFQFLKTIKNELEKNGFILIANHTTDYSSNKDGNDWNEIMAGVDGLLDENAMGPPSQRAYSETKWEWNIKHHEDTITNGLYDWWMCVPEDHKQFLYLYTSFLLTKENGKSFFSLNKQTSDKISEYQEFNLPLGEPISKRYLHGRCWIRDFTNAKIIVNPTNKVDRIIIDNEKPWLDWSIQQAISETEIPSMSGKIFLPIKNNSIQ